MIDAEQWDAINHLETHYLDHLKGPNSMMMLNASISAGMDTDMQIDEVQDIFCAVCYRFWCEGVA